MIIITRYNNERTIRTRILRDRIYDEAYEYNKELIDKLSDDKLRIIELCLKDDLCNNLWYEDIINQKTIQFEYSIQSDEWDVYVIDRGILHHYFIGSITFSNGSAYQFMSKKNRDRLRYDMNKLSNIEALL